MPFNDPEFIDLESLYIAYRKAKVDAFYERDHVTAVAFSEFENNLRQNLTRLLERLTAPKSDWMFDLSFVGSYTYIPKEIRPKTSDLKSQTAKLIDSDPDSAWRKSCGRAGAKAEFRIVGRHPVEF